MFEIILLAAAVTSADVGGGRAVDTKPPAALSETAAQQLGVVSPAAEPDSKLATDHVAPAENPDLVTAKRATASDAADDVPSGVQFARSNEYYTSVDRKV